MNEFKEVTKEEFDKFVEEYPNELDWNITRICEPPMGNHNDFTTGLIWPESMVTKVTMWDRKMDGKEYQYYVKEK